MEEVDAGVLQVRYFEEGGGDEDRDSRLYRHLRPVSLQNNTTAVSAKLHHELHYLVPAYPLHEPAENVCVAMDGDIHTVQTRPGRLLPANLYTMIIII